MQISGTYLKSERKSGTFEGTPYDFTLIHLLDESSVRKVRLPRDEHSVPFERGDVVTVEVDVAENVKIIADQASYNAAVRAAA